jgi:5'(3')-deoxyribonucleotidase
VSTFRRTGEEMRILIDVDGVLSDTHIPWLSLYNEEFRDNLRVEDIIKWEMHELVKPECGHQIYKYLKNVNLYANSPVIDGALDGVNYLRSLGHDIVYVTAGFYFEKVDWLINNGFSTLGKDIIITDRKDVVCGNLIIDDYSENLRTSACDVKILFKRPWNTGTFEWKDIYSIRFVLE